MSIELPTDDTSVGPLDVEKRAGDEGDDLGPASIEKYGDEDQILDPRPSAANPYTNSADATSPSDTSDAAEGERERQRNPLGYTITPPTEAEIDGAK